MEKPHGWKRPHKRQKQLALAGRAGDAVLDAWIFTGATAIDCVWVRGRRCVEGGRHLRRDATAQRFGAAMSALRAA